MIEYIYTYNRYNLKQFAYLGTMNILTIPSILTPPTAMCHNKEALKQVRYIWLYNNIYIYDNH